MTLRLVSPKPISLVKQCGTPTIALVSDARKRFLTFAVKIP
jgi:hypothetical protein